MTRLATAALGDVRLQFRQGFYYAAAFVVAVMILVLRQLPPEELPWLLPVLIFANVQTNAFYFLGGLLLLEKSERTLEAQVVTPIRPWEYLASKLLTLCLLSLLENWLIAGAVFGLGFDLARYTMGIVLASLLFALAGFLVVIRYDSINEYLMPSFVYTTLLSLPFLAYFEVWNSPLLLAHPMQGALFMLRAGFEPSEPWMAAYAAASGVAWIAAGAYLCHRAFHRFVVASEGGRR